MARALRGKDPKEVKPRKAKVLIYGKAGVGKTWASLDFPSVYYIDAEGGATREHYTDKLKESGAAYMGIEDGSQDFDTVIEEVATLAAGGHRYRTVVVDSFTKLYNNRRDYAEEHGGSDFGRDKKEANKPSRRLLGFLNRVDMNAILICHEMDQWGTGPDGKSGVIGQTFDGWNKLEYELDLVLQIQRRGPRRVAIVKKTRLVGFEEGSTFDWGYEPFAERYGRDVIEGAVEAISFATPAQVAALQQLLDVVRVPTDTIDKWLAKSGATQFSEMTSDQIGGCIQWCESRIGATTTTK